MGPAFGNGIVALSGVVCTVSCDTGDLLIGWDPGQSLGWHRRVADIAAGDLDSPDFKGFLINPEMDLAPDTTLWTAMLASVPLPFALRCPAGASTGCGREGTLIPVLSIKRCSGPCDPRCGMFTARVFWRRLNVLKSGTSRSGSIRESRLSTNPVVCRNAIPKRTFIVRQVCTAASL